MRRETRGYWAMRSLCLMGAAFIGAAAPAAASAIDDDKAQTRELRSLEKQVSKLQKRYEKLVKRCTGDERNRPDARACTNAQVTYQDVQELKRQLAALNNA